MSARGIHLQRSSTIDTDKVTVLPGQPVIFESEIANWPPSGSSSANQKIEYDITTGICTVPTMETTENVLYITWAVALDTKAGDSEPIFSLQILDENDTLFSSFPMSSSRSSADISASFVVSLPYLAGGIVKKYYISLINQSTGTCTYGKRIFVMANLIIVSLPY